MQEAPTGLEESPFGWWSVKAVAGLTSGSSFLAVFAIFHQPTFQTWEPSRASFSRPTETISWQVLHSPAGWLLIFILLRNNYILLYTIQLFPAFRNTSPGPHSSPPLHPQTVVQLLTRTRHNSGLQKYLSYEKRRSDNLIFFRCDPDDRTQLTWICFLCLRVEENKIKCNYACGQVHVIHKLMKSRFAPFCFPGKSVHVNAPRTSAGTTQPTLASNDQRLGSDSTGLDLPDPDWNSQSTGAGWEDNRQSSVSFSVIAEFFCFFLLRIFMNLHRLIIS